MLPMPIQILTSTCREFDHLIFASHEFPNGFAGLVVMLILEDDENGFQLTLAAQFEFDHSPPGIDRATVCRNTVAAAGWRVAFVPIVSRKLVNPYRLMDPLAVSTSSSAVLTSTLTEVLTAPKAIPRTSTARRQRRK